MSAHGTHFAVKEGTSVPSTSVWLGQICVCEYEGKLTVYDRSILTMGKWHHVRLEYDGVRTKVLLFGRDVCLIVLLYILKHDTNFLQLCLWSYYLWIDANRLLRYWVYRHSFRQHLVSIKQIAKCPVIVSIFVIMESVTEQTANLSTPGVTQRTRRRS